MSRAKQVDSALAGFLDNSGRPLSGGSIRPLDAGGSSSDYKDTWQDFDKTTQHPNDIVLDDQGQAVIYADGLYKFEIRDSNGVLISTLDNLQYVYTEDSLISQSVSAQSDTGLRITDDSNTLGLFVQDGGHVGVGLNTPETAFHVIDSDTTAYNANIPIANVSSDVLKIANVNAGANWTGIHMETGESVPGIVRLLAVRPTGQNSETDFHIQLRDSSTPSNTTTQLSLSSEGVLCIRTLCSLSGNLNITPRSGTFAVIDSHWAFDGATLTGLSDNHTQITAFTGRQVQIEGVVFDGGQIANGSFVGDWTFDTTTLHIDAANDRVGIGTITPAHALDILSSDSTAMRVSRDTSVIGDSTGIDFSLLNLSSAYVPYAGFRVEIIGNIASSHSGRLLLQTTNEGTLATKYTIDNIGNMTGVSGAYIATDRVRAIDNDGLNLQNESGSGIAILDNGDMMFNTTVSRGRYHFNQGDGDTFTISSDSPSVFTSETAVRLSRPVLELVNKSANGRGSHVHMYQSGRNSGLLLGSSNQSEGYFTCGAAFNDTDAGIFDGAFNTANAFINFEGTASFMFHQVGEVHFGGNTSLTPDSAYRPTVRFSILPQGRTHCNWRASGVATPDSNGDEFVVEGAGNTGLSILSPDANSSRIIFGSPSDTNYAEISCAYNSGSPVMEFRLDDTVLAQARDGIGVEVPSFLGIGASSGRYSGNVIDTANTHNLQLVSDKAFFLKTGNNGLGFNLVIGKTRSNSVGTNAIVQESDVLGQIIFTGDDGTDYAQPAAHLGASVEGTPANNNVKGAFFINTNDGSVSRTRLRIDSAGNMGFNHDILSGHQYLFKLNSLSNKFSIEAHNSTNSITTRIENNGNVVISADNDVNSSVNTISFNTGSSAARCIFGGEILPKGGIILEEMALPSNPSTGTVIIFVDSADGDLKARFDSGNTVDIAIKP